jgi:hypothetical protein
VGRKSAEDKEMKIRKLYGSLAVAITMFALSGIAQADQHLFKCPDGTDDLGIPGLGPEFSRENVAQAIADMAAKLRCTDAEPEAGNWPYHDPIWQKRPNNKNDDPAADGCEVHLSLAKSLDAPPQEKKNSDKGNPNKTEPERRGAARAVFDSQDGYADYLLQQFIDTIVDGIAVPTDDHPITDPNDPKKVHRGQATAFATAALEAQVCILGLAPPALTP